MPLSRRASSHVEPFFFGSPSPTRASMTSPWVHSTTGPGPRRPNSARASSTDTPSAMAGVVLDGQAEVGGKRLEGLHAADVGARDEPSQSVAGQRGYQRVRLAPPPLVEGPQAVVTGPLVAVARLRVPHQEDERAERRLERRRESRGLPDTRADARRPAGRPSGPRPLRRSA